MSGVQAVTLAEEVHHHVADHCPQNSEFFFLGHNLAFLSPRLLNFFSKSQVLQNTFLERLSTFLYRRHFNSEGKQLDNNTLTATRKADSNNYLPYAATGFTTC
jgi:hypothetical protein